MKKPLKFISISALVILAILAIGLYLVTRPRLIAESSSEDKKYCLSFIETDSPAFFGSSEVRIELRSNGRERTERQEINTSIANDGKHLDETNWRVNWKKDHVEVILMGEEQGDEIINIYYIQMNF